MTDQSTGRFACTGPCTRGVCGASTGSEPCETCCECRLTCDGPEPAAAQPVRHTADTITDDDLDQLYAQLRRARRAADHYFHTGLKAVGQAQLRAHDAEERAEQAEAKRDKACTAFNAKVIQLEQLHANRDANECRALAYGQAWQTAEQRAAQAERASASTILQAQRWAARARAAEATLERLEARIDAVLEPQEPTP